MAERGCHPAVSRDFSPEGSLCEWCHKPAVARLTAIGGPTHNARGLSCHPCSEAFAQAIAAANRQLYAPQRSLSAPPS